MSVFTTNGEFVASFGSEEELGLPYGITADEDGFLYVCDWDQEPHCCVLSFFCTVRSIKN